TINPMSKPVASGPSVPRRTGRAHRVAWGLAATLALLTVVLYWPCLRYPAAVYDDPDLVTEHPQIIAGLSSEGIRWAFTTRHYGNWNPLTWLTLELDSTLYGGMKTLG